LRIDEHSGAGGDVVRAGVLLIAVLLAVAACAKPVEQPDPLEALRRDCPAYYANSTPVQRSNVVNRVVVPGYPECVIRHVLGEPQGRKQIPDLPDSEWWFYDRDPGYLQVTIANGQLASWSRCSGCKRWYNE
jgi:hypothetical protein